MSALADSSRKTTLWRGTILGAVLGVVFTLPATHLVDQDAPGLEPGKLTILSGRDDSANGQRQALIDQWNATHPKNPARIIELPALADAAHSEMVVRAQSEGAEVDIYNLDVTWTAEFADAHYIRPLDEPTVDRKEFLPKPIETCVYEGKLWALPFNTDAGLLYYRTDLGVSKPPDSWPLLERIAKEFLAGPHDSGPQAGYTGQLANYEGLTVNALEAIHDVARGDVVRNGRVTVSPSDIQDGIDRLTPPRREAPQGVILRDSLTYDEKQSTQAFRAGKVLFMRNWPVAYRDLNPPTDNKSTSPAVPFAVTTLPGQSVLGGQNLAIAANTTKPRAAQALIEFLTDARSQQILFERGGFAATRKIVYRDAEVTKLYPYAPILLGAIEKARSRPVTPCYTAFSDVFHTEVHKALEEAKPLPADFISTLNTALNC